MFEVDWFQAEYFKAFIEFARNDDRSYQSRRSNIGVYTRLKTVDDTYGLCMTLRHFRKTGTIFKNRYKIFCVVAIDFKLWECALGTTYIVHDFHCSKGYKAHFIITYIVFLLILVLHYFIVLSSHKTCTLIQHQSLMDYQKVSGNCFNSISNKHE